MATLKIKQLIGAITVFALLLLGTLSIAAHKQELKEEGGSVIQTMIWYSFDQLIDNDPENPANYSRIGESNDVGCDTGNILCSVRTPDHGSTPDPSSLSALQSEIATGEKTANVTFKN